MLFKSFSRNKKFCGVWLLIIRFITYVFCYCEGRDLHLRPTEILIWALILSEI